MPYTTIHQINETLDKAIAYICNPQKTCNKLYVHGENCVDDTAAMQFEVTRKIHSSSTEILAFHLIQSFKEGEVTEQQAFEIGIETMNRLLGGQYEYILATHNDKKSIHNHIIINSVNMVNGKSFSTEHNRKSNPIWKQIRQISDEIAKEKGISVIENPLNMGVSHYEWQQSQEGLSWKERLKKIIDNTVRASDNFDDYLQKLQDENIIIKYRDYVKKSGKCLAYKMDGQARFIYTEKLGQYYNIDNLKKRIERSIARRSMSSFQKRFNRIMYGTGKLKRLYDLSEYSSEALRKWAADENRKITMETLSKMKEMGFAYAEDVFDFCNETENKITELQYELEKIESSITIVGKIKVQLEIYNTYKLNYDTYNKSFNKERYFRRHEKEILLFMQASEELEKYGEVNSDEIEEKMDKLQSDRKGCIDKISELKETLKKLDTVKYNLEKIYEKPSEKQPQKYKQNEQKANRKKSKNDVSLD